MRSLRVLACIALPLALAACVVPSAQVVDEAMQRLASAPVCCADFSTAKHAPLPIERVVLQMDETQGQVMEIDGAKTYFALFHLPAFAKPYSLTLGANINGGLSDGTVFLPKLKTLDAKFQVLRQFDAADLRRRGQSFERTMFFNPENQAEHYVVIYADTPGRVIEGSYSAVTVNPVVAGPVMFNMVSGHDAVARLRVAPAGRLTLTVNGLPSESTVK